MDHSGTNTNLTAGPKSSKALLAPAEALVGTGTATAAVVKGQLNVDVRAAQLSPSAAFTVHIHQGTCTAIGSIIRTVGAIQTDTLGSGMVHVEYPGTEVPVPAFIDVHLQGGTEGPVICGDLKVNR